MSAVIAAIVQLAGLAGVKLSPFKAGAVVAGVLALIIGISALAAGIHLYNAGYAAADGAWREKALEAQLAAARADQAEARRAAADAQARADSIKREAEQERAGTDAYVEDLRRQNEQLAKAGRPNACGLTCDDLRGMRIKSAACAAPPGSPAAGSKDFRSRWRPLRKTE